MYETVHVALSRIYDNDFFLGFRAIDTKKKTFNGKIIYEWSKN